MSVLLGVIVAASFGTGDFLGGLASRQARALAVLLVAQSCALVGAVVVAVVAAGDPTGHDLLLGGIAGLLNVTALGCLFRGFTVGRIGVVAPIAAVIGAVIPVGWGLLQGERPPTPALVGVGLAIVAAGLISRETDETQELGGADAEHPAPRPSRQAVLLAVGAGIGFGTSFICYGTTDEASGFWPVLAGRVMAVTGAVLVALATRTRPVTEKPGGYQAVASGLFDLGATTLLLVAVRQGLFATVAPLAALAPGFTVGHAWWYLKEKASRVQAVGLVLALVGLALIAWPEEWCLPIIGCG